MFTCGMSIFKSYLLSMSDEWWSRPESCHQGGWKNDPPRHSSECQGPLIIIMIRRVNGISFVFCRWTKWNLYTTTEALRGRILDGWVSVYWLSVSLSKLEFINTIFFSRVHLIIVSWGSLTWHCNCIFEWNTNEWTRGWFAIDKSY